MAGQNATLDAGRLDVTLNAVDEGLDAALARLFDFLKIASISTDPEHKAACAEAAEWVAGELKGLGFDATVHPTPGHPVVVGRTDTGAPRRVLFYKKKKKK